MEKELPQITIEAIKRGDRKVAVMMGGYASERDVSIASGEAVLAALSELGVEAVGVDPSVDLLDRLIAEDPAFAFIALHGKGGEDGQIQGLLQSLGVPYSGSGVLGSALAMDKVRSKQLWMAQGLATPVFKSLAADTDFLSLIHI